MTSHSSLSTNALNAQDVLTRITTQADLQPYNTLGLPAHAAYFYTLTDEADLPTLCAYAQQQQLPILVLGGGSNVVLTQDYPGLVIKVATQGKAILPSSQGQDVSGTTDAPMHLVEVAAGENWHETVSWLIAQGYPGLENLALIPGTVGAAPIQNIGAYGLELADRFHALRYFDLQTHTIHTLSKEDCAFGYRDSIFKHALRGRALILSVTLALPKTWQAQADYKDIRENLQGDVTPQAIFKTVVKVRQQKLPDPAVLGNAGSFFKNPILSAAQAQSLLNAYPECPHYPQPDGTTKVAAGWLIEQTGWKGRRVGAIGVHERQALVLVHTGGGTGNALIQLAHQIQSDVYQKFRVQIEPEPLVI
ncbi:UDP-N-acetylmuramate dehydrogenase [Parvibium lacunae]|uniref:UDP-N-acetylenolpyruvoylglucosamine reductase n=1 Tax=Parvibium lacunae TaxID=1888893 RepID=A0A368L6Q0_9BURK|nr:UDP-N-acetylmuramate dehydrogenase [Parvibium lacunae]RCS59350.1 UDP-N-acetylmuramate dehydrogenase [Parvibium lacunae]